MNGSHLRNVRSANNVMTGTISRLTRNPTESILQDGFVVKIAVMGAIGAGKFTFIRLLTNDDTIQIGHSLTSQPSDFQTARYTDADTGCSVTLIDTPGFDNSQVGITAADILQKIRAFLTRKSQKLDGIIYMHHINELRNASNEPPKNLKILRELCGDENLRHVCVVTTHWDDTNEQIYTSKEGNLKEGAFRIHLADQAQMRRHNNTVESAQAILSGFIPFPKSSSPIRETAADRIFNDVIEELKKKHAEELVNLKRQTEEALIDELDAKRNILEEKLVRAEAVQERLKMTVEALCKQQEIEGEAMEGLRVAFAEETAKLTKYHEQALEETRYLREQVELAGKQQKRRDEEYAATMREEKRQEASVILHGA